MGAMGEHRLARRQTQALTNHVTLGSLFLLSKPPLPLLELVIPASPGDLGG